MRPSLYDGPVEAIRHLNSRGVTQLLMTGTPRPLAEPLMRFLGLDDAIAAEPGIKRGVYTGRLLAPHPRGRRKVALADIWLREHGYSWEQAVAVADHWDDRFLLERAAVPVAVRPAGRLRKHALRHGWTVIESPDLSTSAAEFVRVVLR